jgi:excisionase family DNA binding protein
MTNNGDTLYLNTQEAAQTLRYSTKTLLKLVAQGRVPAIRLSARKLIFSRSELEALKNHNQLPAAPAS